MRTTRALVAVLALMAPVEAMAQTFTGPEANPYRRWEVGGGLGIRFGETDDAVVPLGSWNADVGRYWTSHFKTSFSLMTAGQQSYTGPYGPTFSQHAVTGPAAVSVTAAYQFFDNIFVHPYIVGGARFASTSTVSTSYPTRPPYIASTVTSSPILEGRPIVGGGFKSYFANGRAFMRSELVMAVNPDGSPHAVLTIGAGVDF